MTSFVASVSTTPSPKRHTTTFRPSIWGDYFLKYDSHSLTVDAKTQQEHGRLRHEVRRMLVSTTDNAFKKLCLIDAVQLLGLAYHFAGEIEEALEKLYHDCEDDSSLHAVSLRFRLLRQKGYYVPRDLFDKFKDDQGKFKASLTSDVLGMLSLYEAAYLGIRGEEHTLDEAIAFTTSHLESIVDKVSPQLAELINHALNRPIRKALPRLEARYYINIYSGDHDSQKRTLLNFAKLDFNMLQVQHQKELCSITQWWKNLDFAIKLPYARDRVVECYFWIMGMCYELQYSFVRTILTKVIAMASVLDDTYDAYGTYEELELFTDAIERWDISVLDRLPEYMKLVYLALLDVYREIEEETAKEGRSEYNHFAINAMKRLVRAYFLEAKWCKDGYVPEVEEYMQNSRVSSGYPMLATTFLLAMEDVADHQTFEWISNDPMIIKASAVIARLMDDIVSHEFEKKREHVASSVDCYMKEHGVCKEVAIKLFRKEISDAWKNINQECLESTAAPKPLLMGILNLSRAMDVIYKDGDGYTNSHLLKDYISSVLINPVLF